MAISIEAQLDQIRNSPHGPSTEFGAYAFYMYLRDLNGYTDEELAQIRDALDDRVGTAVDYRDYGEDSGRVGSVLDWLDYE